MPKVTVKYWAGTTRLEGAATSYRGAMRLASKNQNKFGPTFYDESGVELHDDGNGLAYPDSETVIKDGLTIEYRRYAV